MSSNAPTLRLIDANANRAREALRVLEDYARFVIDAEQLAGALKSIRHTMGSSLAAVLPEALLYRDTPHDVGTSIKTDAELTRESLNQVVTAAGKRLGEAIRSLEEYLKIDHPESSRTMEQARYTFYELERQIALTLRPHHARLETARLYVLITESACLKGDWLGVAKAALAGGADVLQLREKSLDAGPLLERAYTLADLCKSANALFIVNDRPDIAMLSNAHGLHLGQSDLPAQQARKLIGSQMLLGISTHELSHAQKARLDSADYIGAGPTFLSPTKPRDISPGLPYLEQLKSFPLPVFAIAGITPSNLSQVLATGTTRIAVTAAITQSPAPEQAARNLKSLLTGQAC